MAGRQRGSTIATKALIEKVTARVFCHGPGGGNPVTIFASPSSRRLSRREERVSLAQTCDWESVFVLDALGNNNGIPQMAFYMPTGEQVSFCAHAAIGGSTMLSKKNGGGGRRSFATMPLPQDDDQHPSVNSSVYHSVVDTDSNMVSLEMEVPWTEKALSEMELQPMLSKFHQVTMPLEEERQRRRQPTYCNSSIARNKTLVRMKNASQLQEARSPSAPDEYREACDAITSTGLYLYAEHLTEEGAWECVS